MVRIVRLHCRSTYGKRRRDHSCDGYVSVVEYAYAIAIDSSISLFMLFTACLVIMYGKVKVE